MTAPRTDTRVDLRTLLAGLGAAVLLISLFLDWYGEPGGDGGRSAWASFELVDAVLAGLALAVLYETAHTLSAARNWPSATGVARLAGPLALALVVLSIIDDPPLFAFVDPEPDIGAWLALAGAVLMTVASLLSRVRVSFVLTPREPAGAAPPQPQPASPPPHDPNAETRTLS